MTLAMWTPGLTEVLIVVVIILALFATPRIPKVCRAVGEGLIEFKKAVLNLTDDRYLEDGDDD